MIRWLLLAPLLLSVAVLWTADVTSAGEAAGDPAQGEALFQANCAMCHGKDASGMMGMHPALRGAVDRLTVEGVEVTIRNGRDTRPPMPAFGDQLDDDAIADLVAYLQTLPAGPRNFGPDRSDLADRPMGSEGTGSMMRRAMGKAWIVSVVLIAALAGAVGYLLGQRRR